MFLSELAAFWCNKIPFNYGLFKVKTHFDGVGRGDQDDAPFRQTDWVKIADAIVPHAVANVVEASERGRARFAALHQVKACKWTLLLRRDRRNPVRNKR